MSEYAHTEWFDWWDENGEYYQIIADFDVEEVGEWIDGMWCIYHDVEFVSLVDDNATMDYTTAENYFGTKQVKDWIDYVRNKLDEEYVYE